MQDQNKWVHYVFKIFNDISFSFKHIFRKIQYSPVRSAYLPIYKTFILKLRSQRFHEKISNY